MLEQFTLYSAGMFYLIHYTHIHLFPETGYCRHTGRMGLTHRLLHLLRMGVDYHGGTLCEAKNGPAALKDMGIRQEIHHTVCFSHWHTLVVGLHSSMELTMCQDNALGIASSTTGIEDIGNVVIGSLLPQPLNFRLSGQVLTQLQKVGKIDGVGIVSRNMDQRIEDDDAFQRGTQGENATCLVILILLTHKKVTDLGIVDHKLYLLLTTGGIERNGDGTNAPCTKVALDILHRVL